MDALVLPVSSAEVLPEVLQTLEALKLAVLVAYAGPLDTLVCEFYPPQTRHTRMTDEGIHLQTQEHWDLLRLESGGVILDGARLCMNLAALKLNNQTTYLS
jgi:hypothetical protein